MEAFLLALSVALNVLFIFAFLMECAIADAYRESAKYWKNKLAERRKTVKESLDKIENAVIVIGQFADEEDDE